MKHLDAHTVRERLNAISLAISTLEHSSDNPRHYEIAALAGRALSDIAALVTKDEVEEHRVGRVCLTEDSPLSDGKVSSR